MEGEPRHGKQPDQIGARLQKAPEMMFPVGGKKWNIFRQMGITDGYQIEVLEHVE